MQNQLVGHNTDGTLRYGYVGCFRLHVFLSVYDNTHVMLLYIMVESTSSVEKSAIKSEVSSVPKWYMMILYILQIKLFLDRAEEVQLLSKVMHYCFCHANKYIHEEKVSSQLITLYHNVDYKFSLVVFAVL